MTLEGKRQAVRRQAPTRRNFEKYETYEEYEQLTYAAKKAHNRRPPEAELFPAPDPDHFRPNQRLGQENYHTNVETDQ